ncbi:MAG: NAD(P)/FAD-dependent oxidoreductase [Hyphomicrobiales bacterium]
MTEPDIAIIGAGPAGMAAAATCAKRGARVVVLDEQPEPGGQIYRAINSAPSKRRKLLGEDYAAGATLARGLDAKGIEVRNNAIVWRVDEDGRLIYSQKGEAFELRARHVIVANGALERAFPLPGWTLPGAMTAGAAQIMLKSSGLAVEKAVLVGCGPLLYLVAQQLTRAGHPPLALVETQTTQNSFSALRHLPRALGNIGLLKKGMKLLADIKAAGIPRHTAARNIHIEGDDKVEGVSFIAGSKTEKIACETALLHCGVIPNTQITRALRLAHVYDSAQACFRPKVDDWGATGNPNYSVAGDGGGIGGAHAARLAGELAALGALSRLEIIMPITRDEAAEPLRSALKRELSVRPFLDALYPPPVEALRPPDGVTVCRCEEVTAGDIRRFAKLGCLGPNQTKAFGRSGMGPCQGRYCGPVVTEILSAENGLSQQETGAYRIRTPLKPVTLGELASLENQAE